MLQVVQEARPGKEDRWSGLRRAEATVRPEARQEAREVKEARQEAKVKEVKKEVQNVQPGLKSEGKLDKKAEQSVLQLNVVLDDEKTTRFDSFLSTNPCPALLR